MKRVMHRWKVQVQAASGDIGEEPVEAFWDPEHETTTDAVMNAAQVQLWCRAGKPEPNAAQHFQALTAVYQDPGATPAAA